jgi:hypothetical protein
MLFVIIQLKTSDVVRPRLECGEILNRTNRICQPCRKNLYTTAFYDEAFVAPPWAEHLHLQALKSLAMEEDRAEGNLGIAADIELLQAEESVVQRQPKKRFIGRRQAAENALKGPDSPSIEDSGAIQGL